MKITFKIPKAKIAGAAIQMENKNWLVSAIRPLCKSISLAYDGTDFIFSINIGKKVQGAYYDTSGNGSTDGTLASNFKLIDTTGADEFGNLVVSDVSVFNKGISYLVPVISYGVVDFVPSIMGVPIGNVPSYQSIVGDPAIVVAPIFTDTMFPLDAGEQIALLNATVVNDCITLSKYGSVMQQSIANSAVKKTQEVRQFVASVGGTLNQ